jgi:translocation and assembly module TamB
MRKWILIIVAAVLLLPIVLVGIVLYTEVGTKLASTQLHRLERFGVHIEGVSGRLTGPLRVERFELDHPRVHIVSHDIVVEPMIRGLLLQTLKTSSLTARDTLVEIRRVEDAPVVVERPPRFLPSFMRIDAEGVEFTQLRYVNINGMTIDARSLRGAVVISPRHLRVSTFEVDAEQFAASGTVELDATRPLGLRLDTHAELRMPRGENAVLDAELRGTIDELNMKANVLRPSQAQADLTLTRPDESWRIAGQVRSPQFSFEPWLENPPLSLRNVALEVILDPSGIQTRGGLDIPEYRLDALTFDARGRFESRVLHLASVDIGLKDAPGALHAAGTLDFDGGPPALNLDTSWRDLQWPLRADAVIRSPTGTATLRGAMPYDFELDAEAIGPQVPAARGTARGSISNQALTLREYQVETLQGSITGSGSLEFAQPRAWTLSSRAMGLDPRYFHEDFPGRVSFIVTGSGQGFDDKARFTARIENLTGTLREKRVSGRGVIERSAKGWRIADGQARFGRAELTLDGTLYDAIDARWTFKSDSLAEVLPDTAGKVDFNGALRGSREAPHVVVDLRAENLRYEAWRAQQLIVNGDVNLGANVPSRLFIRATRMGRNEPSIESFIVNGAGMTAAHELEIEITGSTPPGARRPSRARFVAAGSFENGVWNATVTTTHLSRGSQDLRMVEPAKMSASGRHVSLENLCLAIGAGQLCAHGNWERGGPWEAVVAGYEIPLAAALPQSAADAEYGGRFEGRVRLFGEPNQPWQADAGMRIIDAAIIYRPPGAPPQTLQLGTGGMGATATPQAIKLSFGVQAFTDTFLFVQAELDRDGRNDIVNLPLRADVRARAGDANILPLVFPEIDHAAGVLTADANITGTLAMPEVNGRVELADGEFDSYRVNLSLRELSVVADLEANRLRFRSDGRAGDGRLQGDGQFAWRDGMPQGNFRLHGENLLVADLAEYRVVASPDLYFVIEGNQLSVAGDVAVPYSRIQPVNFNDVVRTSEDARFVGDHPAERDGRLIVHSEVRVAMGDDVRIDAFGLQGRVTGSVGITSHTGEQAIGRGELAVEEGRYEAYGQKLDISRGRLLFEASPIEDPGLDIEARRKIETVEVGLNVRGTLQEPRLTFFSDPSMPQTQIASYLLVGKPLESTQSSDRASVNSARDALALQGGGLLASQLGRRFGLDEIGVESNTGSSGEAAPALVLGKFLSPRLFVSYGISLTESINTLKLRYTISDRWIFKTEAGENQSADLEFTIER